MNPTSGRTSNDVVVAHIQQLSVELSGDFHIHYTTGANDDEKIKTIIKEFVPERVAACGGDGTVQLAARNLTYSNIPLGIVPLGSANGLARALSLPRNYEDAINAITSSPHIISMDLLKINDTHWCTHLSDLGTNALLVKSYEESGDKGMLGYAKHLIASIQQSDLMQYEIDTPERRYSKEGYMLMIANAHKYGTGVQISEGSVSDGKFEICNVQKIDLESFIKAGLTAINIFVDKDMFSDVISCRQARIKIKPQAHLQIDGEYMGEVDELKVDIVPSAIRVIVNA
jgi:diacylglycerol kinase family enzyme